MLTFDDETAATLERAYAGYDFTRRRLANYDLLGPVPDEHLLDVGCGTGVLAGELALAVGPQGRVFGVDTSPEMLARAGAVAEARENLTCLGGRADDLPLADASVDGVVSVQVFEYIADLPAALREVGRVLRPGGRFVVGDMCYDTWAWATNDPGRMARMRGSWDQHFVHANLPAVLLEALPGTGLVLERTAQWTCTETTLRADGMPRLLLELMAAYAAQNGHVRQEEIDAWRQEQIDRARAGTFFFSLCHVVHRLRRV